MKKFIFFARVLTWLLLVLPTVTNAQTLDVYPNYVVIGAFEHEKNAVFFTEDANQHNFPARFEMNPNRNLYYVYVLTTDDRAFAFAEALKLRTDTKYFDTWVYSGLLGEGVLPNTNTRNLDVNPTTGEQIRSVTSDLRQKEDISSSGNVHLPDGTATEGGNNNAASTASESVGLQDETTANAGKNNQKKAARNSRKRKGTETNNHEASQANPAPGISANTAAVTESEKQNQSTISPNDGISGNHRTVGDSRDGRSTETELATDPSEPSQNKSDASIASPMPIGPPPKRVSTEPLTPEDVTGNNFYFYLFRADNHDMVAGEVDAIDFERSRRMATYDANKQVKIIMPSGKTKQISFLCQVFGYRKLQKEFNPASPAEDMYLDNQGNVVVPFELIRLQKGDIAIMYNVFFFKDAAVMRPESRYEVNNLLELLQENPSYKIRIHGHTNGNAPGKIIYMDKPGNFYSLSNTRQGGGSAKKLSEERALVIREYLISSGISADRMQVEAWGGKKPIHDKNSARAHENVRVEIEILSN